MKTWKWQLAVALVVVFAAGVATGLFAGARHAHWSFIMRHSGSPDDRMRRHLERELKLTPEQVAQVGPIMDRTSQQLETIRKETNARVSETMRKAHDDMIPFLTPEQRERLEEMKRRHQRVLHLQDAPPPPPPPPDE